MDDLDREFYEDYPHRFSVSSGTTPGCGKRLGQALSRNFVSFILNLDLWASFVNGDADDSMERYDSESIDGIIHFLAHSRSLQIVTLHRGSCCYVTPCLEAMAKNPNIRHFTIDSPLPTGSIPPLARWLTTTRTLKQITMQMGLADHVEVANALGSNTSLVKLTVRHIDKTCQGNFLYTIGTRVSTTLKALKLEGCRPYDLNKNIVQALSWLVSSSSTSIEELCLDEFRIEPDFMTFLEGLSNARHQRITSLKLNHCWCNAATTATGILQGVQSSTRKPNTTVMNTKLQEIEIWTPGNGSVALDPVNVEMVAAMVLSAQFTLERFTLYWGRFGLPPIDLSLVWSTITSRIMHQADPKRDDTSPPSFRRLRYVYLVDFRTANNDAMFNYIPKLVSLKELHFGEPERNFGAEPDYSQEVHRFAKAICNSGSLTSVLVHVDLTIEFPTFWTSNAQARVV